MVPKQPYVEVPYVPEEAPPERRVERVEEVVWYKKPIFMPLLGLALLIIVIYFGYQMYKNGHADDAYNSDSPKSTGTGISTPAQPAISSTSGSGNSSPATTVDDSTNGPAVDAPKTDSMPVQPPAGKAYAGSGHLELYRQGNITYQYNTDTGETCVMYASLREWRKPLVYRNACR